MRKNADHPGLVAACAVAGALATLVAPAWADPPRFVREWGPEGTGPGEFDRPRGIDVDADGIVYIADEFAHRVQTFDRDGTLLGGWGQLGNGPGQFLEPLGIAVSRDGHAYVVDAGNYRIQKFTAQGTFVREWGAFGGATGSFTSPWDIAIDAQGNVFVTDASRVQKFDADGNFVTAWGGLGFAPGQFRRAAAIDVAPDGTVYVSDIGLSAVEGTANVQHFSNDGVFLARWGTFGEFPGQFKTVLGVETDSKGNVYVVDHHNFRMQKFTPAGTFLCEWGTRGIGPGQFAAGHDFAIDANDDLFVLDLTNHGVVQHFSYTTAVRTTSWGDVKSRYLPSAPSRPERP